jgi:AbrB family looped-hinge helix DNA binding protein
MPTISAKMAENGRITIPLNVRAAVGLERGGSVVLEVVDGELRLRSVAQAMDRARAISRKIIAGRQGFTVDDFLADRRREAERER